MGLVFASNFYIFCVLIFFASGAKVTREITAGALNHKYLQKDKSFAARSTASEQAGVLAISAIVATLAFLNLNYVPMILSSTLYFLLATVVLKRIVNFDEDDEQFRIQKQNEISKKHGNIFVGNAVRYRKQTLAAIDFCSNMIAGISVCLMPVVFKTISHVSQGMDSLLTLICGLCAFGAGIKIIPKLNEKFELSAKTQWHGLLASACFVIVTSITFTTYFGLTVAYIGAVLNGMSLALTMSFMHTIAARELERSSYASFNCEIIQRAGKVRIAAPLAIGLLSKFVSIDTIFLIVIAIITLALAICILRVSIITREYESAVAPNTIIATAGSTPIIFSGVDRRRTSFAANYKAGRTKFLRRHNNTRPARPSFNRVRDYRFELRRVAASSQTYADMVATWRSHRFRRNTSLYSAA